MAAQLLNPDAQGLGRAADLLADGGLVAFPTETVYGLGADATNDMAVARIYEAKGRPSFNPLIVHVADLDMAETLIVLDDMARKLALAFWPGPLTLVLPMRADNGISKLVTAGHSTLAVRIPAQDIARDLIRRVGRPIAAPSANPSGTISPTTAQHVINGLGERIEAVIDGGACSVGLESTIVATDPLRILRPGGLDADAISLYAGPVSTDAQVNDQSPNAPGQLTSHYAPKQPIRLNAMKPKYPEVFLGFGGPDTADLDLSPTGNTVEAAANLFAYLHKLDALARPIAVAPIPETGLGVAINDRLRRAAAPKGV